MTTVVIGARAASAQEQQLKQVCELVMHTCETPPTPTPPATLPPPPSCDKPTIHDWVVTIENTWLFWKRAIADTRATGQCAGPVVRIGLTLSIVPSGTDGGAAGGLVHEGDCTNCQQRTINSDDARADNAWKSVKSGQDVCFDGSVSAQYKGGNPLLDSATSKKCQWVS